MSEGLEHIYHNIFAAVLAIVLGEGGDGGCILASSHRSPKEIADCFDYYRNNCINDKWFKTWIRRDMEDCINFYNNQEGFLICHKRDVERLNCFNEPVVIY